MALTKACIRIYLDVQNIDVLSPAPLVEGLQKHFEASFTDNQLRLANIEVIIGLVGIKGKLKKKS